MGFEESKRRDALKMELCAQQNIALVVVWYHEDMTPGLVAARSAKAIKDFTPLESTNQKYKESEDIRKSRLAKAKEFRRKQYLAKKRYKEKLNGKK